MRPTPTTVTEVLAQRAQTQPDRLAYTFLRDGEDVDETLTFGQLYERSLALGEQLSKLHGVGERAILLDPRGLDFFVAFFGCLYAGLIPVPVSLPNRQRGVHALRGVALDCSARCLVSSSSLLHKFDALLAGDPHLSGLTRVAVDEAPRSPSAGWIPAAPSPKDILLLQYTSGTTGTPRGVMVTHANMLHNQQQIEHSFGHDKNTVVGSWLPLFHDMGLGTAMQGVWLGVHCVLMSPAAFIQKPVRWLAAVSQYRVSFSGGPDFAFELCTRHIDSKDCVGLDLSCWTGAYDGSEPVRAATIERFISQFAPFGLPRAGVRAVYGLAEATLLVSAEGPGEPAVIRQFQHPSSSRDLDQSSRPSKQPMVSCGRPWLGTRIVIVDPDTLQICRPGREGEIWVGGQSVCEGYWQKPAESEATLRARTADGDGPFLRTGDLGFLEGGGLYITGRLKDLIIIRGDNHYPQDIEATVSECHPSLEPQRCAAFAMDSADGEQLVIVQEVRRSALRRLDAEDVFRAIRGAVSHGHSLHTSAIVLIRPATLPKTSSGKVQRKACAQAFLDKSLAQVATWSPAQPTPARDSQVPPDPSRDQAAERLLTWLRKNMPERLGSSGNADSTFPQSLVLELGKQGLLGMQVDPQYGGLGLGHIDGVRVLEQLAAIDLRLCLFIGLNNALGLQPIAGYAPDSFKASVLPRLVAGHDFAGFAFMEPGGGNTPSSFLAVARAEPSGRWRLFGTKCLHGQSQRATLVNVFVRHEDSPVVTAFALKGSAAGLHVASDGLRAGVAGLAQDTVVLDGVLVDAGQLLGSVGTGMDVARQAMLQTRLVIAAACLGTMKRCAQVARRYSPYSTRISGRLTPNPVTLSRFGSLAARVTTLEALVTAIARAMDAGQTVPAEAFAICKIAGPDLLLRAADDLMQLSAQRGADEMERLSSLFGQAACLRTLDGPPEPVSELLGGLLMDGDAKPIKDLITTVCRAPESAAMLERIVDAIRRRLEKSPGTLTRRAQRWSQTRAGELTAWVVLVAAVEGARRDAPRPELARAASWVQAQFEFALTNVELSTPSELAELDASDVADAFAAYAHTIGDLEGDYTQEPADATPPMGYWEPLSGIHPSPRSPRTNPTPSISRAELGDFIVGWLSHRVRLPPSRIDRSRSFADHGLDSMAAVELAKALSDKLGRTLDETILWNFATIDALLSHLDAEAKASGGEESRVKVEATASGNDDEDALDAEIARLELTLRHRE